MSIKKIIISKKNKRIEGHIFIPKDKVTCPIIIFCHGFLSRKRDMLPFAISMYKHGFGAFIFDFSGHGHSSGQISDIKIKEQLIDLGLVVQYIKKNKKFTRIGIFGYSLGGMVASIFSSKNRGNSSLALLNPICDFEETMKRLLKKKDFSDWEKNGHETFNHFLRLNKYKIKYDFLKEGKKMDMKKVAKKIKCPSLILQSEFDEKTPLDKCKIFYDDLECNKSFYILKKARHEVISLKLLAEINQKSKEWFDKTLLN